METEVREKIFFVCCLELPVYEYFMNFHFPFVNILFARSYEKLKNIFFVLFCLWWIQKMPQHKMNLINSNEKVCWHFNPSGEQNACKWQRCQQLLPSRNKSFLPISYLISYLCRVKLKLHLIAYLFDINIQSHRKYVLIKGKFFCMQKWLHVRFA